MMPSASKLFTTGQKEQIVAALKQTELGCSAEIRVHIENHCKGEVMDRAVAVFSRLKMDRTELRNGVLIYVAVKDHKMAIIGDRDINRYVRKDFWQECYSAMRVHMSKQEFTEGICLAMSMLESELAPHFPHQMDDVNELPDDISFD